MKLTQRVDTLAALGQELNNALSGSDVSAGLQHVLLESESYNPWFTRPNQLKMLRNIVSWLDGDVLWNAAQKASVGEADTDQKVAIIMAGNIPAVGFHDLLCVLLSGHRAVVKLSSDDRILIPYLMDLLLACEPRWSEKIEWVSKVFEPSAVIATGSNNSSRYFEFYFSRFPHIIRKNRNSVAVLSGNESEAELLQLSDDVFDYFGLGCRSVSKLYVPDDYSFDLFFEAMMHRREVMQHNKYMNNYDYHKAVFLLNNDSFLTNNFLHIKRDDSLQSPVSVLHYSQYANEAQLTELLNRRMAEIQCVVGSGVLGGDMIDAGQSQQPCFEDFADGVNTLEFLSKL